MTRERVGARSVAHHLGGGRPVRPLGHRVTEKQLQAAIVKTARLLGWRCYHTYDSRRSEPGYPDLTMVKDGRLLFVELKAVTGKVSDAQLEWLDALGLAAESYVWRPAQWLDGTVERVLRAEQQKAA